MESVTLPEQIVALLAEPDAHALSGVRDGAIVNFALRGDRVAVKLAETGRRLGDLEAANLLGHMRRGGRAQGYVEKGLNGVWVICALLP
ncbi:hypothetical protein [Bordetella genomosp. 9]|uniref:Uncharacterized protein n=1 Tax=Bordetella genomosp. 9 TaxID=1416803 RepID=A0A1W6YZ92_9BORD|nr:hypothetical protein [Bordetella genomosp. 9]ARP86274.1 hypothetical protein CAL13_08730 [Bordetella genomosp. 9]